MAELYDAVEKIPKQRIDLPAFPSVNTLIYCPRLPRHFDEP